MKVVQINETCGTGSIGRTAAELAVELERSGHECLVAYAKGVTTYYNSFQIGTNIDHKVHAMISRLTGLQGYSSKHKTKELIRTIKEYKPDIVHLHNLHSNYINLKMLLLFLANEDIATVITLHDCWFYTGKCTYYVPCDCKKWMKSCGNCPLLHKDNVNPTFFFDRTEKCLNDKERWFEQIPRLAVVGVSQWVAKEAEKSIFKSRHPITIYNWIDLEVFHPRDSDLLQQYNLDGKFVIIMVATYISRNKGYNEMIDLSNQLPENWTIIVIGNAMLPIPKNVIHIPHTDNAIQLAEFYSMADVCMNTTQYETFGKVTAEAICCGTPVIVYDNTASPELVDKGCGFIVEQSTGIEGIMKALKEIYQTGKEYYSAKCLKSAHIRFKKNVGVEQYIRLYERLSLKEKGKV